MESDSIELRRYIAIFWKYLWLIILTTLLAGGAAYYVSARMTPIYSATATLKLDLASDPANSNIFSMLTAGERLGKTYVAQIKSTKLMGEVAESLGMSLSPKELRELAGKVSVEQVRDTQLIDISVEDASPAVAQGLANKVAEVFTGEITAEQQARFENNKQNLDEQIAELEAQISDAQKAIASLGDPFGSDNVNMPELSRLEMVRVQSQLSSLQTRYTILLTSAEEFRLAAARYSDSIILFAPAELPDSPVKPSKMKNTLLGMVVGMMVGAGVAFLREYLDDTIKTSEDVTQALGLVTLGSIFRVGNVKQPKDGLITTLDGRSAVSEGYRTLRTNLQFCGVGNPGGSLLITSASPSEGKTTTAANLAVILAQGGKKVILVDADLRRPSLTEFFETQSAGGLTNLLVGEGLDTEAGLSSTSVDNLRVMPSGPIPPNAAELLGSPQMSRLLDELGQRADMIILDSPPALAVTDASVAGSQVDGALLVINAGVTRREVAQKATETLQKAGVKVLGVVLNKLKAGRGGGYYYYQYYGKGGKKRKK